MKSTSISRWIIGSVVVVFGCAVLQSCLNSDDCSGGVFGLTNVKTEFNVMQVLTDTNRIEAIILASDPDTVQFDEFGIVLGFNFQGVSQFNQGFSFFPSAYACPPSITESVETMERISVTSDQKFDADHPASTQLNDLFNVIWIDHFGSAELMWLPLLNSTSMPVAHQLFLIPKKLPEKSGSYNFTVEFIQADRDGKTRTETKKLDPVFIKI